MTSLRWVIATRADLDRVLNLIRKIVAILHALGLQGQYKKTQVMLSLRGRKAKKWLRSYTSSRKVSFLMFWDLVPRLCKRP